MIKLPDVTMVVVDTKAHALTKLALDDTLSQIEPAEVLVFTDDEFPFAPTSIRKIEPLASMDDYNSVIWGMPPFFVKTSHMLVFQWDGWVTDGSLWSDDWLQYDYIGARWPWFSDEHCIGNGGFSLRSMRLVRHLSDQGIAPELGKAEDLKLCRDLRPALEAEGFRWAPVEVAELFSFEIARPPHATFGFHDVRNFRHLLTAERLSERFAAITANAHLSAKEECQAALHAILRERRLRQTLREIFPE